MTHPIKIESILPSDLLEVQWDLTNYCNFNCHYCFPGSSAGDYKVTADLDLLVDNFTHFVNEYKQKLGITQVHLKFGGGEPTLWKNFGEFIQKLKDKNKNLYIGVVTNGSRTLRWWEQYGHLIDNATLSFHYEQADLNHHIAVADILSKLGKKTTVLVLMDPAQWDDIVKSIDYMKSNHKGNWFIEAKTIVDTANVKITYTAEQQKFLLKEIKQLPSFFWFLKNYKLVFNGLIKRYRSIATFDNGQRLKAKSGTYLAKEWNKFKGWSCDIGKDHIYIKWSGEVQGACGQTPFQRSTRFNILDEDFKSTFNLDFKPSICSQSLCNCQPETHISKIKLSDNKLSMIPVVIQQS